MGTIWHSICSALSGLCSSWGYHLLGFFWCDLLDQVLWCHAWPLLLQQTHPQGQRPAYRLCMLSVLKAQKQGSHQWCHIYSHWDMSKRKELLVWCIIFTLDETKLTLYRYNAVWSTRHKWDSDASVHWVCHRLANSCSQRQQAVLCQQSLPVHGYDFIVWENQYFWVSKHRVHLGEHWSDRWQLP